MSNVITRALRHGLNPDVIDDFLASVDWSGTAHERPPIADTLGQLESWSSDFGDGALSESRYVAQLLGLFPEKKRNSLLYMDGGRVLITVAGLDPVYPLKLDRSGDQPQTGSRIHLPSVPSESRSDSVRVA